MPRGKPRRLLPRFRVESLEDRLAPALFTVNTLADENNGIDAGGVSLREAIAAANATAGPDTIDFSVTGTIPLTSALPTITGALDVAGPGAANLTVRRNVTTGFAIFTAAAGSDVGISGLKVANASQGGVVTTDADLTLTGVVFDANVSGGAVKFTGTTARALTVADCAFTNNVALSTLVSQGITFAAGPSSTLVVTNGTFNNPNAQSSLGGVIHVADGTASVTGCTFTDNPRGAIDADGGSLTITDCDFTDNDVRGAVSTTNTDVTIADCNFISNNSVGLGGAVGVSATVAGHRAVIRNSLFDHNSAPGTTNNGGGVGATNVSLELDGCTFDGNTSGWKGHGLYFGGDATAGNVLTMSKSTWRNHLNPIVIENGTLSTANDINVTMTDCVLDNNTGRSQISGSTNSSVVMTGTRFTNNHMGIGPGLWVGLAGTGTSLSVADSVFENNTNNDNGTALGGGAATVMVSGSTFRGNVSTGDSVGGMAFNVTNLDVTNCVFVGNASLSSFGGAGGLGVRNATSIHIADSTFVDNYSGGSGGGLNIVGTTNTLIERTTFARNFAGGNGGGALIAGGTLINCTFSGNTSNELAGGLLGGSNIRNCTFTGNRADSDGAGLVNGGLGGGVWLNSTTVLHNNIIAGNFSGGGSLRDDLRAGSTFSTNNVIGVNTGNPFTSGVNGNIVGTAASPIDPRLAPLADNGGSTQTHALLPDSPALDSGNDSVATYATDQRGAVRIADGPIPDGVVHVDMGAYESGTFIAPIPDQPVAEDGTLVVPLEISNASLPGLVVTATSDNPLLLPNDADHLEVVNTAGSWSLVINPAPEQWGATTVTITATRGVDSASTTFYLLVPPSNDAPLAAAETYSTAEDTPLTAGSVLDNDDDYHGGAPGEQNIPLTAQLVAGPSHAAAFALAANGTFTYTPATNFHGTDAFTYRALDTLGGISNVATVTITVTPVNDTPTATADVYTTDEDAELIVPAAGVLGNDADADGVALTAALMTSPVHGTLALSTNGAFAYTPDANFNGTDSFTYRAFDGLDYSAPATVAITVNRVNDAPTARGDSATGMEDAPIGVDVLANDAAVPDAGETLTIVGVTPGTHGTVIFTPTGVIYTPDPDDYGVDSFTYTISDGNGGTATAGVWVIVQAVNDPPVARDDAYTTAEDTQLTAGTVLASDTDPDAAGLTSSLVQGPAHGLLLLGPDGGFTYTPDANYNGPDTFIYRAFDGELYSQPATVTIQVRNLVDLSGRVYNDRDNDGVYDPGDSEAGIGGIAVELFDQTSGASIASRTTAADGTYTFDVNLAAGTYKVVATQSTGFLDGRETAGNLGGTTDNSRDGSQITTISVGDPGTSTDATDYLFGEIRPSQALGLVWADPDNDGAVDFGETAIAGVTVELTGTDDRGNAVARSTTTDANGVYSFIDLRPTDRAGYTIRELQPTGFVDGLDVPGTVNGATVGDASVDDAFSALVLPGPGSLAENYNFGERPPSDGGVTAGQTATIGFWQNKNGQNLIKALNGGSTSTQLGNWLATTFPNMYGAGAGVNNLAGKTNAQVAAFYKALFARTAATAAGGGPAKLDAQVLATAFAVYVTNQSLAGTTASSYGFQVTENGVGARTFDVESSGAPVGVANNSNVSVLGLLLAVNDRSRNGVLYDLDGDGDATDCLETSYRTMANDLFAAINEAGDL